MKFMLMIIDDEVAQSKMSAAEQERMFKTVRAIEQELQAKKLLVDSRALRPSAEAATVRIENGAPIVTEGPFAETKEVLGGYFLIECASKDEAIRWAARFPAVGSSSVEVRPIWEMSS